MKKIAFAIARIAFYLGVFYALLYGLNHLYRIDWTAPFVELLGRNPALFMATLFASITLVYALAFAGVRRLTRGGSPSLAEAAGLHRLPAGAALGCALIGVLGCLFSIGLIEIPAVAEAYPSIPALVDDLLRGDHLLLAILGAGLVAPAYEELLFRGLILRELRGMMPAAAALLLQALAYAYFQPSPALSVIGFGSGLLYGYLRISLNSLWAPILVQITAMSLIFAAKPAGVYEAVGSLGGAGAASVAAGSLLLMLAAAGWLRLRYASRQRLADAAGERANLRERTVQG
ncbi:type II CAAX prenyl endopeptidase Rce1 family protein [Paenibacillus sp. B01]|uniref:CPBP family glutamic-type intramembrane protease n=1 Tax=Paenibacillus sp. B01 TaxID=2660554 RepID=UPI00129AC489|nr:CPBP family glutamic-type intramembrane protease [Paenibacillus sp. B01]QGG55486.1 CPBP family intramembrane metalloprotease [Paenibacillus sp. B01]